MDDSEDSSDDVDVTRQMLKDRKSFVKKDDSK